MSEYVQEIEGFTLLFEGDETKEMKMAQFLGGLREDIRKKLEANPQPTLKGMYNSAMVYEKYAMKRVHNVTPHPRPYKLRGLDDKAKSFVKRQCLVKFSIGSYKDPVLCDVLDMNACQVLQGRLRQYDRNTIYNGFSNIYTLTHEGKINDLLPLPPHRSVPPPKTYTPLHLVTRKDCDRELKAGNSQKKFIIHYLTHILL